MEVHPVPEQPELAGGDTKTGATRHQRPTLSIILTFIITAAIVAAGVNWYKDSKTEIVADSERDVQLELEASQELIHLRAFEASSLVLHCENSGGVWSEERCACPDEQFVSYDDDGYCISADGSPMGILGEGFRNRLTLMMGEVPEEVPVPEGYEHFISQDGKYSFSIEKGSTVSETVEGVVTSFRLRKEGNDSIGTLFIERFPEGADVLQLLKEQQRDINPESHCVIETIETERPDISNIVMYVSPDFPEAPELDCLPALSGLYWQLSNKWNAVITLPVGQEPFFKDPQYTMQSLVIYK